MYATAARHFNSRLYMRGNREMSSSMKAFLISIHASTWEATRITIEKVNDGKISIHASTWEATRFAGKRCTVRSNISIHASTWEATIKGSRNCQMHEFQFTPLHERQPPFVGLYFVASTFQFTPLHERQPLSGRRPVRRILISIHASTWEATVAAWKAQSGQKFQFTPLHERQLRSLGTKMEE